MLFKRMKGLYREVPSMTKISEKLCFGPVFVSETHSHNTKNPLISLTATEMVRKKKYKKYKFSIFIYIYWFNKDEITKKKTEILMKII